MDHCIIYFKAAKVTKENKKLCADEFYIRLPSKQNWICTRKHKNPQQCTYGITECFIILVKRIQLPVCAEPKCSLEAGIVSMKKLICSNKWSRRSTIKMFIHAKLRSHALVIYSAIGSPLSSFLPNECSTFGHKKDTASSVPMSEAQML